MENLEELKNLYKENSPRTYRYMCYVIQALSQDLGSQFPPDILANMDLLADALDLYYESIRTIKAEGLLMDGRQEGRVKNPAVSVYVSTSAHITKLLNAMGLTRLAKSRLKIQPHKPDMEDYIDDLVNG